MAQPPEDSKELRQQLEALRARIQTIESGLQAETAKRDALLARLAQAERRVGDAARALREVEQALEQGATRLGELEAERKALEAALAASQERLAQSVRAAYRIGREPRLKLLLNQENPAVVGRVLAYYHYLQSARLEHIQKVSAQITRLQQVQAQILEQQARLADLRLQRQRELDSERTAFEQRRRVLAKILTRIQKQGATLTALEHDEHELQRLLEQLEVALSDIPARLSQPFANLKGQLSLPLRGDYAAREVADGFLTPAPTGTPVHAIASGRVAFADWLRGYGLLIILDHGDGYMSLYAHNHSLFRDVGDWVQRSEVIAEVGKSGGRSEAALYFELRHDARPVSALAWFAGG